MWTKNLLVLVYHSPERPKNIQNNVSFIAVCLSVINRSYFGKNVLFPCGAVSDDFDGRPLFETVTCTVHIFNEAMTLYHEAPNDPTRLLDSISITAFSAPLWLDDSKAVERRVKCHRVTAGAVLALRKMSAPPTLWASEDVFVPQIILESFTWHKTGHMGLGLNRDSGDQTWQTPSVLSRWLCEGGKYNRPLKKLSELLWLGSVLSEQTFIHVFCPI